MKKYFWLSALLSLASCVTPENWKPSDHAMIMQRCRIMCKKTGASGYDAWTAECTCNGKSHE